MALEKDMEKWQIKKFLEEEVKDQIFLEIAPILYIGQEAGGYFGVTRQIVCFFDFLGALYYGYSDNQKNMKISKPDNVKRFITNFIATAVDDKKYEENGALFYEMYRH